MQPLHSPKKNSESFFEDFKNRKKWEFFWGFYILVTLIYFSVTFIHFIQGMPNDITITFWIMTWEITIHIIVTSYKILLEILFK